MSIAGAAPLNELVGITKTYGTGQAAFQALQGVDLVIASGEFVAVMGPSGSGKSTAMNILGCLDTPTSISAKRTSLTPEDAMDLAVRAVQFKKERGRIPALDAQDAWRATDARRRVGLHALQDGGTLCVIPTSTSWPPSFPSSPRRRRRADVRRAMIGSSLDLRKSSASSKTMAVPRSTGKTRTFSSGCMPSASTACAHLRTAAPCLRRWIIKGF